MKIIYNNKSGNSLLDNVLFEINPLQNCSSIVINVYHSSDNEYKVYITGFFTNRIYTIPEETQKKIMETFSSQIAFCQVNGNILHIPSSDIKTSELCIR